MSVQPESWSFQLYVKAREDGTNIFGTAQDETLVVLGISEEYLC